MARSIQPLIPDVYAAPPEIWTQIFNMLEIADLLHIRASGSSHFKALAEDHPTFCNNIYLPATGSTVLFHNRCKAGARKGYAIRLCVFLRFNDQSTHGHVLSSDARSGRVASIVATLWQFHSAIALLNLGICSEHFYLLGPYFALPAPQLEYLSISIIDYDGSQVVQRFPDDLFQGRAPFLHEVQFSCIAPPAKPCVLFPSVRALMATGNDAGDEFTLPLGYYPIFPHIEELVLGGEAWLDATNDEVLQNFGSLNVPKTLKHIKLAFEEIGKNGRLCWAMSTHGHDIESITMTSLAYDDANMKGFLRLLRDLHDTVSLTVTVHRAGHVNLSFVSNGDAVPHLSRALEVTIPHDDTSESVGAITIDLYHIFKLLQQVSALSMTVTELHIDAAAGPGIISQFCVELSGVTALVLVMHPETEPEQDWLAVSDIWLDLASGADDGLSEVRVAPDPRLQRVRTVRASLSSCVGAGKVDLHETDADTLATLIKRLPQACAPLNVGSGIILTVKQRQMLMKAPS